MIAERLGHASIETTIDTYVHLMPRIQEKAAIGFDDMVLPKEKQPM
ncbi:hypothetical protein ACFLXC_03100 [Chloroflexota bacterium]